MGESDLSQEMVTREITHTSPARRAFSVFVFVLLFFVSHRLEGCNIVKYLGRALEGLGVSGAVTGLE